MARTIIGKVGVTPKQVYSNITEYKRLDIVTYDGCSYMCLKDCTGIEVANEEYWQLLAEKGHFTEQDKEEFKQAVMEESKAEINEHTEAKKTELDNYTNEFETSLKTELDAYENIKKSELDTYKNTLETEMSNTKDSLVQEIETAQSGFDANVETKTQEFNNNATAKTTAFNENATEQTNTFNTNAETKTNDFDTNANTKKTEFDNNATTKLEEYNDNTTAKVTEFNENVESYATELEELAQQMPWNTTEIAESLHVEDSAKYSRNKLNLFGNLEQETSETGNNIFDGIMELGTINSETGKEADSVSVIRSKNYIDISNLTQIRVVRSDGYSGSDNYTGLRFYDENKNFIKYTTTILGSAITLSNVEGIEGYKYIRFIITNTTDLTLKYGINKNASETYEDYIPNMPSLNYPSMPVVVTGVQEIKKTLKNIFDGEVEVGGMELDGTLNSSTNRWRSVNYINVKKVDNVTIKLIDITFSGAGGRYLLYDKNKKLLVNEQITADKFTIDTSVASYLKFWILNSKADITTKVQIEQGDIATDYEPYTEEIIEPNLKNIELCRIGNYRDYIYRNAGIWYKKKLINKMILTGNEVWGKSYGDNLFNTLSIPNTIAKSGGCSNYYRYNSVQSGIDAGLKNEEFAIQLSNYTETKLFIKNSNFSDIVSFKEYLKELYNANNPVVVYYPLETAIDEQITDETLIEQLEKLYNLQLEKGTNNIFVESENGVTAKMQLTYMQDLQSKLNTLEAMIIANATEEV